MNVCERVCVSGAEVSERELYISVWECVPVYERMHVRVYESVCGRVCVRV